jgi:hypothetical protein
MHKGQRHTGTDSETYFLEHKNGLKYNYTPPKRLWRQRWLSIARTWQLPIEHHPQSERKQKSLSWKQGKRNNPRVKTEIYVEDQRYRHERLSDS